MSLLGHVGVHGADGTKLFGINLFGGYRNLYGISHAPEVAETRLDSEVNKLALTA